MTTLVETKSEPDRAAHARPARPRLAPLPVMTAASLLALAPPEPALLGPIAPGTITLIRGPRGVGKSWLALAMAHAIACGTGLLGWSARPAPVLCVEAAMSHAAMAARLKVLGPVPGGLSLLCDRDFDLGDDLDAAQLDQHLPSQGTGLLVLDGLSLLVPPGRNARLRWGYFCDWLRGLRRKGHAILLIDHTRRPPVEDLADTVITLKKLAEDEADVPFSVETTTRQALARADRSFAARLDLKTGAAQWTRSILIDPAVQAVAEQAAEGATVREIAEALGLSPATAWRRLERAKAQGLVADKPCETSETRPAAKRAETSEIGRPSANGNPPETNETGRASGKPRETSETRPALARVSTEVLHRTLKKRLKAQRKGLVNGHRPGPAILAQISDEALLAECAGRVPPERAERLMAHFAPLLAA